MPPAAPLPLNGLDELMLGSRPLEFVMQLEGRLDADRVHAAFREAIAEVNLLAARLEEAPGGRHRLAFDPEAPEFLVGPHLEWSEESGAPFPVEEAVAHAGSVPGTPLVRVTLRPLRRGALLAVSLSHVAVDGMSIFHFLSAWGAAFRGEAYGQVTGRHRFELSSPELEAIRSAAPRAFTPGEPLAHPTPQRLATRFVSEAELERLVELASSGGWRPSAHQAQTAALLREFGGRFAEASGRLRLRTPVDVRGVHPGIEFGYVGNAFFDAMAEFDAAEFRELSIAEIAARVRDSIRAVKNRGFVETVFGVGEHGVTTRPAWREHLVTYEPGVDVTSTDVTTLGDVYERCFDFGAGVPRWPYYQMAAPAGFIISASDGGRRVQVVRPAVPAR